MASGISQETVQMRSSATQVAGMPKITGQWAFDFSVLDDY